MGFARTSGTDFKNQCGRLTTVLQVMAITLTGFEASAIASVEDGIAGRERTRLRERANGADWTRRPGLTPTD